MIVERGFSFTKASTGTSVPEIHTRLKPECLYDMDDLKLSLFPTKDDVGSTGLCLEHVAISFATLHDIDSYLGSITTKALKALDFHMDIYDADKLKQQEAIEVDFQMKYLVTNTIFTKGYEPDKATFA